MRMPVLLLASMVLGGGLAGCAVKYGCPAPNGVTCKPISEVYTRSLSAKESAADPSPGKTKSGKGSPGRPALPVVESPTGSPPKNISPIRSTPKILRVWITPWIDAEGDLHQEGYLYVVVDQGKWAMGLPEVESDAVPKQMIAPDNPADEHTEPQKSLPARSETNGKK